MAKGLTIPLSLRADGTFNVTEDPVRIVYQRILDLLVTSRWDRVHRPDHGCDLEGFLYTSVIDHLLAAKADEIINTINSSLSFGRAVNVSLTPLPGEVSAVQVDVLYQTYEGGGVELLSETFITNDEGLS